MSSPTLGPVDNERYISTTWTEALTKSLPPFVLDSLNWLGEKVGYSDPFHRHLEVILQAPSLAPLPEIQEELPVASIIRTPIHQIIDTLSEAAARAASLSSSTKGHQVETTRMIAKELIEQGVNNLLEELAGTPSKDNKELVAEVVQKLSSHLSQSFLKETVPSPTYTESASVEKAVREIVRPILTVLMKRLLELDEEGAICHLVDRVAIQLNNHVAALNKASYSLMDFKEFKEPGCHPVIKVMPYEGVNDPTFRATLESVIFQHFHGAISTFFNEQQRSELFKALYQTRGEWLSEFEPDLVERAVISKLIQNEDDFIRVAECAYQFFVQKYKDQVVHEAGTALINFTEPRTIKGIIYGAALPPVINLLKEVVLTKSYTDLLSKEESPFTKLKHLANFLYNSDETEVLNDLKVLSEAMAPLTFEPEVLNKILDTFKKLPYANTLMILQEFIKRPPSPPAEVNTRPQTSEPPAAYGHLMNELLFGIVLQIPGITFFGGAWESNLSHLMASGLSFIRDDPNPLFKILTLAAPGIESSLSREKVYEMITAPPKEPPSVQKQLDDTADLLIRVAKVYVPDIMIPAKVTLSEVIRTRIDMLFDAQWKNLNLVLLLLDALNPPTQPPPDKNFS